MARSQEALKRAELSVEVGAAVAATSGGGGEKEDPLPTYIGILIAVLGVVLAFAASKGGSASTDLVTTMISQQHAHSKYESQDIKHRGVVNVLRQMHAGIPVDDADDILDEDLRHLEARVRAKGKVAEPPKHAGAKDEEGEGGSGIDSIESARILGRHMFESFTPEPKDAISLADAVTRYYAQAQAADAWPKTYDALAEAHSNAGSGYDRSMLLAEIGIVIASVALLLKRKIPFVAATCLGVASIAVIAMTWTAANRDIADATAKIAVAQKGYDDLIAADKVSASESELASEMREWGTTKLKEWADIEKEAKSEAEGPAEK